MASIDFDGRDLEKGFNALEKAMERSGRSALEKICDEILRLTTFEVPHDKGSLQTSGAHEVSGDDERTVGYNKVYAARLHEHPEYRFQKGRKGKYLIDPIIQNLNVFKEFTQNEVNKALS